MNAAARPGLVRDVLEEYGGLVRGALGAYLPDRQPGPYLYRPAADYPQRGGKMLRPSLCIATARVFGAAVEDVLGTAVSLELMHNALLIHDDIEDESELRRGSPTLHRLHGVPMAINVGDMLSLLSLRPLIDNRKVLGPRLAFRILEETERAARETAEGQALELGWRRDNVTDLREPDYLELVLKKTCWLTSIYPVRVGALIGTRDRARLDCFVRFGFFVGAAFQIRDDVLNLVGDRDRYGKEINGDLAEGKRTLLLISLLERGSEAERRRVESIYAQDREDRCPEDVSWVRRRIEAHGCIEYAEAVANGLASAAHQEFEQLFGSLEPSRDLEFIRQLITWMIERE